MLKVIAVIVKIPIFICTFWAICLISILLHEFGHALGYMLVTGDRNWYIQVGQGKNLLTTKALTINIFVIDGFFSPAGDKTEYSKSQLVMMLSGGPIMSLLLAAGLSVLIFGGITPPELIASGMIKALFYAAFSINLFILLWSVIPARGFFRDMEDVGTDGMQIINALRRHRE